MKSGRILAFASDFSLVLLVRWLDIKSWRTILELQMDQLRMPLSNSNHWNMIF